MTPPTETKVWGRLVSVQPVTRVCVDGEWITFDLFERVKLERLPLPTRPLAATPHRLFTTPRSQIPRRKRIPTGILMLTIRGGASDRDWRDRNGRWLEDQLTELLAHLPLTADWRKQAHVKAELERCEKDAAEQPSTRRGTARTGGRAED